MVRGCGKGRWGQTETEGVGARDRDGVGTTGNLINVFDRSQVHLVVHLARKVR